MVLRRRMVRDFADEPVPRALVEQLVANATRSLGRIQSGLCVPGVHRSRPRRLFWETTSGPEWRGESESLSLTRAPVVIVPLAHKQAYLDRYGLPDKAHTPFSGEEHWPAPYWDIDTGFGVMLILLTAVDLGLGALFFAIFQGEKALLDALGVPGISTYRSIALGHPTAGERSDRAAHRPPPPRRDRGWERW